MRTIRHEIERFDPSVPLERALTPPASWYLSPDIERLERTAVFQTSWLYVAAAEQVATPGAWVGGCHAGIPWLVVRDLDGTLRAFHNSCRHKATPIAMGQGTADGQLTCPYHGWRYGLDGALQRAPHIGGIASFDRTALGLPPMAVTQWGPLIMVHPDPEASPLRPDVSEIDQLLSDTRWGSLRYRGQKRYDLACNWKVFADNYLDGGYHIPHLHPSLAAQLDLESYETRLFDRASVQTSRATATTSPELAVDPTVRVGSGAVYAFIYPNLMINRYGPVLDTNLVVPTGPESCRVLFDFWFDAAIEPDDPFIEQSMRQSDKTQQEDIDISESVQVGLRGPSYDRGPYAPRLEHAEHHFHRLLSHDLRSALQSG